MGEVHAAACQGGPVTDCVAKKLEESEQRDIGCGCKECRLEAAVKAMNDPSPSNMKSSSKASSDG